MLSQKEFLLAQARAIGEFAKKSGLPAEVAAGQWVATNARSWRKHYERTGNIPRQA